MMLAIPQLPDKGASLRALACNLPVNRLICRQSANARNWGIYSYADNECIFSAARMRIHTIFRYLFPTPHRVKYLLPCRNDEASYGVGESYGNRRGEVRAVCHRATTLNRAAILMFRSRCDCRDRKFNSASGLRFLRLGFLHFVISTAFRKYESKAPDGF